MKVFEDKHKSKHHQTKHESSLYKENPVFDNWKQHILKQRKQFDQQEKETYQATSYKMIQLSGR